MAIEPNIKNGKSTNSLQFKFENFPIEEWITVSMKRNLLGFLEFRDLQKIKLSDECVHVEDFREDFVCKLPVYDLPLAGIILGEEVEFQFKDSKDQILATQKYIPRPITRNSKTGNLILHARLVNLNPTHYFISLEGFKEGEKIKMSSQSGKESMVNELKYFKQNQISFMPGVLGQDGGKATVQFERESKEAVKVALHWGRLIIDSTYEEM